MKLKLGHALDPLTSAINRGLDSPSSKFGGWLNDITGSSSMLKKEYANNVALWNMQNEYNTPAAQIARMKAAGIDVNPMTYAVGNGNMSTTASNISAPSVGASGINPIQALLSVMSGIEAIKGQKLQNDMAKEDLKFYQQHHYRPGTSDWTTKFFGAIKEFGPDVKKFFQSLMPGFGGSNTSHVEKIIERFIPLHDIDYDPSYRDYRDLEGNPIRVRRKH